MGALRDLDDTGGGLLMVVVMEPAVVSSVPEGDGGLLPEAPVVCVATRLFGAHGRRVRVLPGELHDAGGQTLDWDGRDDAGGQTARGICFFHLELVDRPVANSKLVRIEYRPGQSTGGDVSSPPGPFKAVPNHLTI